MLAIIDNIAARVPCVFSWRDLKTALRLCFHPICDHQLIQLVLILPLLLARSIAYCSAVI